jgi:hypothetical protein
MARLSDLPWKPPAKRYSKRWLWIALFGTVFVLGHFFNRADDGDQLAGYRSNAAPPENETSAIADAAPRSETLAHNEPSAIASSLLSTQASTTKYETDSGKAQIASPNSEDERRSAASNYTVLRRELLRHLR